MRMSCWRWCSAIDCRPRDASEPDWERRSRSLAASRTDGDATKQSGSDQASVEELLRYDSPLETATERYALEDMIIAGQTIPRGALVFAVLASANRDDSTIRPARRTGHYPQYNRHLSFGQERITAWVRRWLAWKARSRSAHSFERMPGLKLGAAPERSRWRRGMVLRGLEALPVMW
jgi:hypothetical protein